MELRRYWEIIWRRKWIFISSFFIIFAAIVTATKIATPVYEAKAKILIEKTESLSSLMSALGLSTLKTSSSSASDTAYDTDIALTTIRPVLDKLIAKLKLKDKNGETLTADELTKSALINKILHSPFIAVEQVEESALLEITADSPRPAEAAAMANELAQLYIDWKIENVKKDFNFVHLFLENKIANVKNEYRQALSDKRDFMAKEGTVNLQEEAKDLLQYMMALETKLNGLLLDVEGKKTELTSAHPDIVALNKQIDAVQKSIDKTQGELMRYPFRDAKYSELDLVLSVNQEVYKKLKEYLMQVGIAESITLSDIRFVEPAVQPKIDNPSFPNSLLNYILGIFLALLWAGFIVFLLEYIDHSVNGAEDIENYKMPLLGVIPKFKKFKGGPLISELDPNDSIYESYRRTIFNISFARPDAPPKKMLICSLNPKEGSSITAANIGIIYAREGKKVLLVDADLRRSHFHRLFGCNGILGLTDLLVGNKKMEEVTYKSGIDGLSVLSGGTPPPDPGRLLKSERMRDVIGELENRFDVVILNSAPLLVKYDAMILAKHINDVIVVVKNRSTTHPAICMADKNLKHAKIIPIGTILNCVCS